MKHIKTVAMSLLLANSFSSNEVTWKEIEAEIKPHIEEVESDFSALEKEIQKIYKDYKAIQGDSEFDNLEAETVAKGYNRATKGDKRANKKKSIEAKKENNKTDKQHNETYKKKKIKEIKNNIEEIINNKDQLKINQDEVKLTKIESIDIEKIKKDLTLIKNIYEKMIKINKLKTFRELQEFTKEFSHVKYLIKEKKYNCQYLYSIVYTAIKEKIAIPFLNIIKAEAQKKQNSEKIASSFYPYDMAIENSFIQDDNYHNNVMKNILNEEKIKKEKETLKEKYKRSLDITVFTALSNKQDKKTLEENAPDILTMLETLKGTEAENKKMTVRQALEIFNNFISQTNNNMAFDTNEIREAKKENKKSDFEEKSDATKKGFSVQEKTKESARGILAKEKRAAQGKAKKEAANKKQEAFNQNMTEEEKKKAAERAKTFVPKEKMQTSQGLREAIKERNHKMTEEEKKKFESGPNFNTIDESDTQEKREKAFKEKRKEEKRKNYETYDNKEELRTSSFDITKQELAEAKKNKFNEI